LVAQFGLGDERKEMRIPRVSPLERLVVHGDSGTISLDALRWLHNVGAGFVQIGFNGESIATGGPSPISDVKLRRAQAFAGSSTAGLEIARSLLTTKVASQRANLDHFQGQVAVKENVSALLAEMFGAASIERLRFLESRAAAAYWSAWEEEPIQLAGKKAGSLPQHWCVFGTRSSYLTAGPRKASNAGNALLNYLYAVLEAEARMAAIAVGCDPQIGIIHVDSQGRQSFACDLMEPVRPAVDLYFLRLLRRQTFVASDFFETRDGNCRLMPSLTVPLSATSPQWAKAIAPIAESVGGSLRSVKLMNAESAEGAFQPARYRTPLTGRNRSRPKHGNPKAPSLQPKISSRCKTCGFDLGSRKRIYCDDCLPSAVRAASTLAVNTQRSLRAAGLDKRSSESARQKHRDHSVQNRLKQREWEEQNESLPSRAVFRRELSEALRSVSIGDIRNATGLSHSACHQIRRGRFVPHPLHWPALRELIELRQREGVSSRVDLTAASAEDWKSEIEPFLHRLGAEGIQNSTALSASYSRRILQGHHIPRAEHWPSLLRAIQIATHGTDIRPVPTKNPVKK
jgi:CRISPR-associated endonuclease Cas1